MSKKTIRAFVDRFEGDTAVILIGNECIPVDWPLSELPDGVAEGTVLRLTMESDSAATQAVSDTIDSLIDRLERED